MRLHINTLRLWIVCALLALACACVPATPVLVPTQDLVLPTACCQTKYPAGALAPITPAPSDTSTPTRPIVIRTKTKTPTPARTRPTKTPVMGHLLCSGEGRGIIDVNQKVYVCTKVDGLIVREFPSNNFPEFFRIYPYHIYQDQFGQEGSFEVVDGPYCDGESTFWQIIVKKGTIVYKGPQGHGNFGTIPDDILVWVRDGAEGDDPHWLCPWPPP